MCGLVGAASTTSLSVWERDVVKELLFVDTLRGPDSTGIFNVNTYYNSGWLKQLSPGYEFIQDESFEEIYNSKNNLVIAGHNRKATMGEINIDNAHPFRHGEVTLMHNGTLNTVFPLTHKGFGTDSEHIAYYMNQESPEDAKKVIEQLNGAFALVWWDDRDKTLNFCRNADRSLYVGFTDRGKASGSMFWASDKNMLKMACDRNHERINEPQQFQYMKHYKYSFRGANIELVSNEQYKEYYDPVNWGYGNGNRGWARQSSGQGSGKKSKTTNPPKSKPKGERRRIRGPNGTNPPSYFPKPFEEIEVCPFHFTPYQSDRTRGKVTGFYMAPTGSLSKGEPMHEYIEVYLHNQRIEAYEVWSEMETCWLIAKVQTIVFDHQDRMWRVNALFDRLSKESIHLIEGGPADNDEELDSPFLEEDPDRMMNEYVKGYRDLMIPRKNFDEATKHGCMRCSTGLTVSDAHKIHWVDSQTPLCPDCGDLEQKQTGVH